MSLFKRKITWGEALFGKNEHRIQMRRARQMERDFKKQEKHRKKEKKNRASSVA